MNGNYGVPRDIFASIKIVGFIVWDILFVFGSGFLAFLLAPKVFPMTTISEVIQMVIFILLSTAIAFYLVLPANGGEKNWDSLLIAVKRRKKRWISFDWRKEGNSL
ncbi:hypothetical protein [Enterococcus faecalis]|uniref:hypothetical protein n=1 Tax=Enterococcus faecalis TaxID=1351 RepID=UPI001A0B51FB|nr:hypothetical protein [Enterococcus faecalis]EGO8510071.1 hypothetical protein [Enterococcus faecalis]EGO8996418.1 hypothetical protein [Enterococcus faecalis]EGQ7428154.1 hypothetical protein [Enterococcus faecalis]